MRNYLALGFILFFLSAKAQATFEQSYLIGQEESENNIFFFNTATASYHYSYGTGDLLIYDVNHQAISNINLPISTDYNLINIQLFTDKLFNNDDLIEFILVTSNINTGILKMELVNQNGAVLQNFGDKRYVEVVKTVSGVYKLITSKGISLIGNLYTSKDVYSLSGSLSTNQESYVLGRAFPNPAFSVINLKNTLGAGGSGNINIFSATGQQVYESEIVGDDKYIQIDISKLPTGTYIYKIGATSGKFIKR